MMDVRIGVAGLAHFHIYQMLDELMQVKGTKVVALADENIEFIEKASSKFNIPAYPNIAEMFKNSNVDIIVSAAINNQKVGIILQAIEMGIPIIVDKPMVTTLEDLDKVEKALKCQRKSKLFMMLTERFNPALYTAKNLIEAGEIGEVVNIISLKPHRFNSSSRPEWFFDRRVYGGLINDLAVHDVDIFRWFTNSEVEDIIAATSSNKRFNQFENFDDKSEVLVKMADGSTGYIRVDWLTPDAFPFHGDYRLMVVGTKGQIEIYTANPKEPKVILCNDTKPPIEIPITPRKASISEDFISCIMDEKLQAVVSTEDALISTRVALNAQIISDRHIK